MTHDSLVLPNLKNPSHSMKPVFLSAGDLPDGLLLSAKEHEPMMIRCSSRANAGWSRLQMACLSVSNEEVGEAIRSVDE